MKKTIKFLGVLVACFMGLNIASAQVYNMTEDMKASDFDITEDTTINGNNHTITGNFTIRTEGIKVIFNNVKIDVNAPDDSNVIGIDLSAIDTTLELNNVSISNYTKAGIYADQFASIVVDGSTFDGTRTVDGGEGSGSEADLVKRSAAGIDINIGNSAKKEYAIEKIFITNSTFKNVLSSEQNTTGGGIKIKVKNKSYLTSMPDVIIENNTFTDNVRDLVIGTDAPAGETTRLETGNFNIKLLGNSAMKVVNNSSDEALEADRTQIVDSNYLVTINYGEGIYNVTTEDEKGTVVDASSEDFSLNDSLNTISASDSYDKLVLDYKNYTITINKSDIVTDLNNTVKDLSLNITETTENDDLKGFVADGNIFIKSNESGVLPASQILVNLILANYAGKELNLYYYNSESKKLEFVDKVNVDKDGLANITLKHYSEYVLSINNLIAQEDIPVVENPSTNDNIIAYATIGLLCTVGIAATVIFLKKKNN